MVCPFGGFSTIGYNEVRDLTASLLTEVCHNVVTEPSLWPITSETFCLSTPLMMIVWMLRPEASRVEARIHVLMLGYFTPMLPVTAPLALLLFINTMKMQRRENMVIELGTLSTESSLHWSLILQVAWDVRPLYFTGI